MKNKKRLFIIILLTSFYCSKLLASDPLLESLKNLFGVAVEYLSVSYQRAYLDKTFCGQFSRGAKNKYQDSLNEISGTIRGDYLQMVTTSVQSITPNLKQEVDGLIGKEPSAISCGWAAGKLDREISESKNQWSIARINFLKLRDQ